MREENFLWVGERGGIGNKNVLLKQLGSVSYGETGKTMMMDLFYDSLESSKHRKQRIHFHEFMLNIHRELKVLPVREERNRERDDMI